MPLAPGLRLGPYEILAAIGAGGMGEVYRARDTRLQRDVAIKILPAGFADDPDRRVRFEREAHAIAALSHPNVLAIYDTGEHEGHAYLVTELLAGETLADRLKNGALPVRKALDIGMQIARGLAAAHDRQIVHRDLKPQNLFLLRDGLVKILDFGLARHVELADGATATAAAVTDPGVVMGTVGYMAPEQVRGQAVDARTDLFAFGAVLYEMLTGQRAFRRDTAAETMTAVLRDDPPDPTTVRGDLPPALDRIVRHCLEKNPAERFETARDVAFALETISGSSMSTPDGTGAARPAKGRPVWLIAAAIAGVGAIAWLGWLALQPGSGTASSAPITIGTATQVTADDGLEIHPALSPDGRFLAYARGTAGQMRIFIRPVSGGRTLTLSDDPNPFEYQPRFSPNGNQILYLTPDGAFLASALGGTSRRLASGTIRSAAWAPDGKQIVLARGDALFVVASDGGGVGEREIAKVLEPHSCAWAPTGTWIACVSGNGGSIVPGRSFGNIAPSRIVLFPVSGGPLVEVVASTALNQSPAWSADGRHLYFVSNREGPSDIYSADIGPDGGVTGHPHRITTGLGVQSISLTADGRRLAYATYSARANLWSLPVPTRGPVDTSAARWLTNENQIIESVTVSADRRWVVYDSDRHANFDIFRVPVGGGPTERLTTNPAPEFAPDLSPDGRELAFHSFRSGARDIFVKSLDGGEARQITQTPSQEGYPTWAPDGRAIAFFDQLRDGNIRRGLFLIRRDAAGRWGTPEGLRRGVSWGAAWSPNGRTLVYPLGASIEAMDLETRQTRVVYTASGPGDPQVGKADLSEDGHTVYFKSHGTDRRASIWSVPFAGGKPTLLVRFTDSVRESVRPDFAEGAGQFFFTLEDRQADIWVADLLAARPPDR